MSAINGILFRGIVVLMIGPRRSHVPPDPVLRPDTARLVSVSARLPDMPEIAFFAGGVVQSEKV